MKGARPTTCHLTGQPGIDYATPGAYRGVRLSGAIAPKSEPAVIRNVSVERMSSRGVLVYGTLFLEVSVRDVRTSGMEPLALDECLFNQVTLAGELGIVHINGPLKTDPAFSGWTEKARAFYATVDWALDVRDAVPQELEFRYELPPGKVRYDPETAGWFDLDRFHEVLPHCEIGGPAYWLRANLFACRDHVSRLAFLVAGREARATGAIPWLRSRGLLTGQT